MLLMRSVLPQPAWSTARARDLQVWGFRSVLPRIYDVSYVAGVAVCDCNHRVLHSQRILLTRVAPIQDIACCLQSYRGSGP